MENDGYDMFKDKGSSPFTEFEKFSGVEITAVLDVSKMGDVYAPWHIGVFCARRPNDKFLVKL